MITPKALALCLFTAAHTYAVPPSMILGMLKVENGRIGEVRHNANHSSNLGPMQINTVWVPEVVKYWKVDPQQAIQELRDDPCMNIGVSAWILSKEYSATGNIYSAVAEFHEDNPEDALSISGKTYEERVIAAIKQYRSITTSEDLLKPTSKQKHKSKPVSISSHVYTQTHSVTKARHVLSKTKAANKKAQDDSDSLLSIIFSIPILAGIFWVFKKIEKSILKKYVCTKCGTVGLAKTTNNSGLLAWFITIILYLFYIIPGLICTVFLLSKRKKGCSVCRSADIVPVDTPIGRATLDKITKETPQENKPFFTRIK